MQWKMVERHSRAERQRLKHVFVNTIRMLCQKMVRYDVQLAVHAVIGITVDEGQDVVFVSLNELIGKDVGEMASVEEQCYDAAENNFYDNQQIEYAHYVDPEDADPNQEFETDAAPMMQYGTVVKREVTSTIMYKNGHHPQTVSATQHFKSEPYLENAEQYYAASMNRPSVGLTPTSRSAYARSGNAHTPGSRVPRGSKSANAGMGGKRGAKVPRAGFVQHRPTAVGRPQAPNGEDAVAQVTLYTCGTCGLQLNNYGNFMRHKQTHTGQQVCVCQGCRKVIKRRDNLRKHQRTCQAYLGLLQMNAMNADDLGMG